MTLIVDSREPKRVFEYLQKKEAKFQIQTLAYGDFLIMGDRKNFVIERKDIFDFVNSVESKRMWEQAMGLEKYEGYQKIVMIEGDLKQLLAIRKGMNFGRWIGMEGTLLEGWDVSIVRTSGLDETLSLIWYLEERLDGQHNHPFTTPNIKKEGRSMEDEVLDVIMAFEGIGGKIGTELIENFKSLKNIFKKKDKLAKVIGDKKAQHIFDVWEHEKK